MASLGLLAGAQLNVTDRHLQQCSQIWQPSMNQDLSTTTLIIIDNNSRFTVNILTAKYKPLAMYNAALQWYATSKIPEAEYDLW